MLGLNGRWTVGWLITVFGVACTIEDAGEDDVERVVEILCEEADRCGCEGVQSTCETRRDTWDARLAYARAQDLAFDSSCFDSWQRRVELQACASSFARCDDACAMFFGGAQLGESCEALDDFTSNCVRGATCLDGTCVDRCTGATENQGLQQGERCVTDRGQTGECAADLYCDWDTEQCQPLPAEGERCWGDRCAGDLWCDRSEDPEGLCQARGAFGEACTGHRQCESGFCPAGFCVEAPVEGESCADTGLCAGALRCDDGVCTVVQNPDAVVCDPAAW